MACEPGRVEADARARPSSRELAGLAVWSAAEGLHGPAAPNLVSPGYMATIRHRPCLARLRVDL